GGILSPIIPWEEPKNLMALIEWSQTEYPQLCRELFKKTGINPEWQQSGYLMLQLEQSSEINQWCSQYAEEYSWLDASELERRFPRSTISLNEGLWLPKIAQIRNPRLLNALRKWVHRQQKVQVYKCDVSDIADHVSHFEIKTTEQIFSCSHVIVAAGAWSQKLLQPWWPTPWIKPMHGQMLCFKPPQSSLSSIVGIGHQYAIPRRDGNILFGSTLEDVGFEKSTTEAGRQELEKLAYELEPNWKGYLVHHWSGLRPAADYPRVQKVKDGLWINAGHYRNGLTLAPVSAFALVEAMVEGNTKWLENFIPKQLTK
ncbi:MAG: FAD-dependent oxidoreductase, partial [Pseudomonadota bacterium]